MVLITILEFLQVMVMVIRMAVGDGRMTSILCHNIHTAGLAAEEEFGIDIEGISKKEKSNINKVQN